MFNRYTLAALAGLALLAGYLLLRSSEEQVILAQLEELRELCSIPEPESSIEQLATAREIAEYFSETATFDFTGAGHGTVTVAGRQELLRHIVGLRARLATLELALDDPQVRLDRDTAEVQATGSGLGMFTGRQNRFLEIHTGIITLAKEDGAWRITGGIHLRDERQP